MSRPEYNPLPSNLSSFPPPNGDWTQHALWWLPWKLFKLACFLIGLALLVAVGSLAVFCYSFYASLPEVNKATFANLQLLAQRRVTERLVDKKVVHKWTALSDVSRDFLYSLVLSEDSSFFEHSGFDFEAMANSLAENIKERRPAFGGSTISQQVAKNLFLENEKTLTRKVKELFITRALENYFSKNELLEIYFNIAEFGPDVIGVEAASRHFFNKTPDKINPAEGAFIALMLPSPKRHYYAIFQNKNLTRMRKRKIERVLRDMLYEEFLSEEQYHRYANYNYFPDSSRATASRSSRE